MNFVYDLLEMNLLGQSVIVEFNSYSSREKMRDPSLSVHYHDMWELLFVHENTLFEQVGDNFVNVQPNELLLIPPGVRHRCTDMSREVPIVAAFKLQISNTDRSNLTDVLRSCAAKSITIKKSSIEYLNELNDMYSLWRSSGRKNYVLAERMSARLKLFLCDVIEAIQKEDGVLPLTYRKKNFIESNIIDYILLGNNYNEQHGNITVERLANTLGYSVEHTERMIKQRYGKSFRTIMYENKLEHAKTLLAEQSISIDEIAKKLLYKNKKSFSESFRVGVGKTPVEYRHECLIKKAVPTIEKKNAPLK